MGKKEAKELRKEQYQKKHLKAVCLRDLNPKMKSLTGN
jgi:hypothetical protein